jgi:hypothetical protein
MGHESPQKAERPDSVNVRLSWKETSCGIFEIIEHQLTESGGKEQTNSRDPSFAKATDGKPNG